MRSIAPMLKRTFSARQRCCNSEGTAINEEAGDQRSRAFGFGSSWLFSLFWFPNGGWRTILIQLRSACGISTALG